MPQPPPTERFRALTAARLAGAAAMGVVAQVAVDMPGGYFGREDEITLVGAVYASGMLALTAILLLALRRGRAVRPLVPAIPTANVGLFLPALAADPLVAGLVVVWNLTLLAQQLFPPVATGPAFRRTESDPLEAWLARWNPAVRHLALVSLALAVAVVGYRLSGRLAAQIVCLVLAAGTLLVALPFFRLLFRAGKRWVLALALPVAGSLAAAGSPQVMLSLLALTLTVLLVLLFAQERIAGEILQGFYDHPSRLLALSFAGLILVGTVLLTFPAASAGPEAIAPLDALFTATSATCVTGLIVLDTPNDLSTFGHAVVLGLIQVGGLGIMTLSTFGALLLGGSLGLRGEQALSRTLDLQTAATAYRLTRFIVLSTLAVEAVGAAGLAAYFRSTGLPLGQSVWRGVFHSVSAFCNAGFALQSDSVTLFQERPGALLLVAALIVLGGLGFVVLAGIWNRIFGGRGSPLTAQVRVVLIASAVLLIAGMLLYLGCEWKRSLGGLAAGDKLANGLFQSVTLRTAGFNSVDLSTLAPATVLFMMLFMFIGASPGSTGGGIKTTTLVVLLAAIRSTVRSGEPVRLFDREVPREIVLRSLAIVLISATAVAAGLFGVLLVEDGPFVDLLFETVSAFGTVGLSLGATMGLGPVGKLIIIGLMFIGRTGPLTLALLLGTATARTPVCRYPQARIMVG